jgi:hypothetical protein
MGLQEAGGSLGRGERYPGGGRRGKEPLPEE